MIVYKITCLANNKVYIGQTVQSLEKRFNAHTYKGSGCTKIYRAIQKYGRENFIIEELESCNSMDNLNKAEEYWIDKYNSTNDKFGYNLTSGGENYNLTKEVKAKISKSLTGKKFNRYISKDKAKKIAKINGSKTFEDPIIYEKWLKANGSKFFDVYEAICIQPRKRDSSAIYEKGEFVGTWLNTVQFNLDLFNKKTKGHISACLLNKRSQYKGYIFEYSNLNNKEIEGE